MADEVTVNLNIPDQAEIIAAVKENTETSKGVIESLDSAAQSINDSAEKIRDAASDVKDLNINVKSNGDVTGTNTSLLESVEEGGESQNLLETLSESLSKRGGTLGRIGDVVGDVGGRLGEFGNRIGNVTESLGGAGNAAGNFASRLGTAGTAIEGAASALGRAVPYLAAIPIVLGATEEAIDIYQSARDVSISQTGSDADLALGAKEWAEARLTSMFTGLDENEATGIQQTLISNRAAFGSRAYTEGYGFAQEARLNYGIEADRAAQLYARAVMRGTTSINELGEALDSLAETSKETGYTMSELTESYTKSVDSLSNVFGGGAGADIATDIAKLGLSPDQQTALSGQIAQYSSQAGYGSLFSQSVTDYMSAEGGEMDVGTAMLASSMDMTLMGYNNREMQQLAYMPLGQSGKNLNTLWREALENRDFSEMEDALTQLLEDDPGQYYTVLLPSLRKTGVVSSDSSTPADISSDFERVINGMDKGKGAGLYGEEGARDLQARLDQYKLTPDQLDESGYVLQNSIDRQRWLNEDVSEAFGSGDFSSENLDNAMVELMRTGVFNPDDVTNLSEDALYKLVRETGEDFSASGETSWSDYISSHKDELKSGYADYIGQFSETTTGREADKLAADITIKFEGELGEYLEVKRQEAVFRRSQDQANM